MLVDYHIHTNFSDDAAYPMEAAIQQAISFGLSEICFTEHIDYGVKTDLNCDCDLYWKEFQRCRDHYRKRIHLKFGIEFGIQTHTITEFQKTFDGYDFDFVILSCHQVNDNEFWTQDFQKGKTQEEYNQKYYEEILKTSQMYDDYCVLGHLDMIKRYDKAGDYPFEKTEGIIEEILKTIIARGKGIEVNTSSFRYGLKDLTPSRKILSKYLELGGSIITLGSDAHQIADIGYKIDYIMQELERMKFKYFCTFNQMKPIFHRL